MGDKGLLDGMDLLQLGRTDAILDVATNDSTLSDVHMGEALEPKNMKEESSEWRTEKAMLAEDDSQKFQADERMLTDLPYACISVIVSNLGPKDVARAACVCKVFRDTFDSDSVWEQLVPKSSLKVLGLSNDRIPATKKEMFSVLRPYLLSDTLAYWLDKDTGGACYSLAARGLGIVWGEDEKYWNWTQQSGARWPEVARLKEVCFFHASGTMKCILPPGAYTLSWRILYRAYSRTLDGWQQLPVEFRMSTTDGSQSSISHRYLNNRSQSNIDDVTPVRLVDDGWLEFDVGEVTIKDEGKETSLEFSMVEIDSGTWKTGVFLDGVVLRPTSLARTIGRYLNEEDRSESWNQNMPPLIYRPSNPPPRRGPIGRVIPIRRGEMRPSQTNLPRSDGGES
ncbi:putative F-box protein PP2-B12 [Physcomitrium patens]|uniref:F-box domain-containing protein n=1 Tax=Physcomitrium patens TaxID=3218 RepID=A0A2K1IZD0_PHYPA|nr:F-box protein PP2-A15-like [Physcomitrium patens]PNR34621.1 hypothetical protein PHYPA_024438 [Physcomitrium patens]|eukprot:XP_024403966.1 F-box protein PP2-A15-like [Physcomitrella patens]